LYEREKRILHTIFFETIVFEEFRQPNYVLDSEWTSRATVRPPPRSRICS
jgi:hypothetical protein